MKIKIIEMKKLNVFMTSLAIMFFSGFVMSCVSKAKAEKPTKNGIEKTRITWYSMDELPSLLKKEPRKVIVDVYTDWCKWCKVMDQETFENPEFIEFAGDEFYFVKLNAEQKGSIVFKGEKFEFVPGVRRGHHELAASLLEGRLSYPSFVILDESLKGKGIIRGFKDAETFQSLLSKRIY